MNDIDTLRQMYATLCGAIDEALTLLEHFKVWQAIRVLQAALHRAEELCINAEQTVDELAQYRRS